MAKSFLTRSTIEDMIAEGRTEYRLGPDDVVTHHARDHARSKGFQLVPADDAGAPSNGPSATQQTTPATSSPVSRQQLRAAVIAALGRVPDGLDEVIDRAMKG